MPKHLLVLARLDAERRRSLNAIATATRLELANVESTQQALAWLERHEPSVAAFDTSIARAEKLCEKIRSRTNLASVPIIALAPELDDVFAEKLFSMGADDVIPSSSGGPLITRLRALPVPDESERDPSRGKAVVADKDRARCDVFGRVLSNAGYDVKTAIDDVALKFYAQQADVRLVVASSELGDPKPLIEQVRKVGSDAVWVVTASRRELDAVRASLADLPRVAVIGLYLPPENVLFASNELISGSGKAARASARVLYGTLVAFRGAGDEGDELGFSYNASAGGLFVRTLAPPDDEKVWLELRPPRSKQRVRLLGRVAWRRGFGWKTAATAPPGFGVELTEGLGDGLTVWRDGYATLVDRPPASAPRSQRTEVPESERPGVVPLAAPIGVEQRGGPPRPDPARAEQVVIDVDEPAPTPTPEPVGEPAVAAPAKATPPPKPALIGGSSPEESSPAKSSPEKSSPEEPKPPLAPEPKVTPDAPAAKLASAAPPAAQPAAARPAATLPSDPVELTPARRRNIWLPLIVIVLLSGAVGYYVVGEQTRAAAPPSPRDDATSVVTPSPPTSAPALPPAAPVSSQAADATAPAADAAEGASPTADDSDDGSKLNWAQGYLTVRSKATDADVFVSGYRAGPTNDKHAVRCGLKWVRLGKGEPPAWISEGSTVDIKCRSTTTIEMNAD